MEGILNNKKGLSAVIATVILVALTMVTTGIIWSVISNLVEDETSAATSCFGILEKVNLEDRYTCYNSTSKEVQFSINVGDIEISEVLVGISTNISGVSFTITKEGSEINSLTMFNGSTTIFLPGKEAGETYAFNISAALGGLPSNVQIIPVVSGTQCEVTDSIGEFGAC